MVRIMNTEIAAQSLQKGRGGRAAHVLSVRNVDGSATCGSFRVRWRRATARDYLKKEAAFHQFSSIRGADEEEGTAGER